MLQIRRVLMVVCLRFVTMRVGMQAAGRDFPRLMAVIVVAVVVRVAVIVGDLGVIVRMSMRLG